MCTRTIAITAGAYSPVRVNIQHMLAHDSHTAARPPYLRLRNRAFRGARQLNKCYAGLLETNIGLDPTEILTSTSSVWENDHCFRSKTGWREGNQSGEERHSRCRLPSDSQTDLIAGRGSRARASASAQRARQPAESGKSST